MTPTIISKQQKESAQTNNYPVAAQTQQKYQSTMTLVTPVISVKQKLGCSKFLTGDFKVKPG
jgi:hypothetical protein